jgi:hypothetical protein
MMGKPSHGRRVESMRWIVVLGVAVLGACIPGSGPPLDPVVDDAGAPPGIQLGGDASPFSDVDLGDPFAVTGLQPSHGPWTGGTGTTIAGRGFSSAVEVWIGGTALDPSEVFASSPTRIAVVTPPGAPGPADVRVQDPATGQDRTLAAGFFYDSFVVTPSAGATSGGTLVELQGSGTNWTAASTVTVGGQPCTSVEVTDVTHLACITPPGAVGTQDVTVTNADGSLDQASDAFTYSDSPDGYRGGLFGGALAGHMTVLAFDQYTGAAIPGAQAIAGSNLATAVIGTTDASGTALLTAPSLTGQSTVTVAAPCHQPTTFVDVPVDTVTVYLTPVLDVSCAMGDPPSNGNGAVAQEGTIIGELVWAAGIEFTRGPWSNIPDAIGNERQAAYVWVAGTSPTSGFSLPPASSATTPTSDGALGYGYTLYSLAGNQTVYALAGIENRSVDPPTFVPYAMGLTRGVFVSPGQQTTDVYIPMTTVFDHALAVTMQPPLPSSHGPDRLQSTLAVDLGTSLFAILPQGTITNLLPVSAPIAFSGIPGLDGTLAGAAYNLTGAAVTGPNANLPISVVDGIETTDANDPITVGGFLAVPTLTEPSTGTWTGTHVTLQAGGPVDLAVLTVSSADGLVAWTIVAPGSDLSFDLPDLTKVAGVGTLEHGAIQTTFSVARITGFDYGQVRYGQLAGGSWSAYAQDMVTGSY